MHDKIEKTVMHNQSELQGLRKVCDKLTLVKPEQESESDRPNHKVSRSQGNKGIGADYSSLDSETTGSGHPWKYLAKVLSSCVLKEPLPGQHDTDSLQSLHEEKTRNTRSNAQLVLPRKSTDSTPLQPIGLHV